MPVAYARYRRTCQRLPYVPGCMHTLAGAVGGTVPRTNNTASINSSTTPINADTAPTDINTAPIHSDTGSINSIPASINSIPASINSSTASINGRRPECLAPSALSFWKEHSSTKCHSASYISTLRSWYKRTPPSVPAVPSRPVASTRRPVADAPRSAADTRRSRIADTPSPVADIPSPVADTPSPVPVADAPRTVADTPKNGIADTRRLVLTRSRPFCFQAAPIRSFSIGFPRPSWYHIPRERAGTKLHWKGQYRFLTTDVSTIDGGRPAGG
eukprot:2258993-Rhodomonas_salina.2